jgi:hypothetical protein
MRESKRQIAAPRGIASRPGHKQIAAGAKCRGVDGQQQMAAKSTASITKPIHCKLPGGNSAESRKSGYSEREWPFRFQPVKKIDREAKSGLGG